MSKKEPTKEEAIQYLTEKKPVAKALEQLAELYVVRNAKYGDNYKLHGIAMQGFFPRGIVLATIEEFNRYSCFKEIVTRLGRYAFNFDTGGHKDSLDDISVYAQLLQELDDDQSRN